MADNNKILICWNNTAYIKNIKIDGYEVEPFTSKDSLNTINQKAKYIVVLCELLWSHDEKGTYSYSDLHGIKLGQWLRREKNIKIPILFVSFLSCQMILDMQPDAEIISTPALKHSFCQLPFNLTKWVKKLEAIGGEMSALDLIYTKRRFCGIVGLLEQINHDISSCWTKEVLNEKLKKLQYADEKSGIISKVDIDCLQSKIIRLPNVENLNNKEDYELVHAAFKDVCQKIIYSIQNKDDNSKGDCVVNEKKYSVLYIEDEQGKCSSNKDERIEKLIINMRDQGFNVISMSKPEYNKKKIVENDENRGKKFDVILCDIEIWENKRLTHLGFNYIKWLKSEGYDFIYIILSNVTRNLYSDIINDIGGVNTYSKNAVLSSDLTEQVFIDGIKNLINQKRETNKRKDRFNINAHPLLYFRNYLTKLDNESNYPLKVKTKTEEITLSSPQDYIAFMEKSIDSLENKATQINNSNKNSTFNSFVIDNIGKIGAPEKNISDFNNIPFTRTRATSFIRILIARRFLIYMMITKQIELSSLFIDNKQQINYIQHGLLFPSIFSIEMIRTKDINVFSKAEIAYIQKITNN